MANAAVEIHHNFTCDGCGQHPIQGPRHHSLVRENFDLCQICHGRDDRDAAFGLLPGHAFTLAPAPSHAPAAGGLAGCPAFPFRRFAKGVGKSLGHGIQSGQGLHHGVTCDGCGASPIEGMRYQSLEWSDYDLCSKCHDRADRAEAFGVLAEHKFEHIEPPTVEGRIGKFLNQLSSHGVDLPALVPKIAEVCMSTVQNLGDDELLPLLDVLLPLTSVPVPDVAELAKTCVQVIEIIQQSNCHTQMQFWSQCSMSMPSVLAELEIDLCSMFEPCMRNLCDPCTGNWQKKMFKGFGKGFGKGLFKGKGKFKGKGWRCEKGFENRDRMCESNVNPMEAAMQTLLSHPCDKIRSAAEDALEAARSGNVQMSPDQMEVHREQSNSANSPEQDDSSEHSWVVASAVTEPQASFVGEAAVTEPQASFVGEAAVGDVLSVNFDSAVAGDVTHEWVSLLQQFPLMNQAYNLGCLSRKSEDARISLCFCLLNAGSESWPSSTTFRIVAGDPCGSDTIHVGEVAAGDIAEIKLQLRLSAVQSPRSCWALEVDGQPFGPLVMLDLC